MAGGARRVVLVALAGNLAIALAKFTAAAVSGSSAMLSEGVHSLVDTSNELLLLYGMHRAARPPDSGHPFGHGRELYFWAFVVALLLMALGAGVSFYEGIQHLRRPQPLGSTGLAYLVLLVSAGFEATSWWAAVREIRRGKGQQGWWRAFRTSKDPTTFTVLLEDSAALLGLLIAFAGLAATEASGDPRWDGIASLGIGLVLAAASGLLARESKALLIGEAALPDVRRDILEIAGTEPGIRGVNGLLTVQMGAAQVVAALSVEFRDTLTTSEIEACIGRIEDRVRALHAEVLALFIKPQTPEGWAAALEAARKPPVDGSGGGRHAPPA